MTAIALPISDDQVHLDDQRKSVVGPPPSTLQAIPEDDATAAESLQQLTSEVSAPKDGPSVADLLLLIYADAVDDLEHVRIATENRIRSLRQIKGMDGTPEVDRLNAVVAELAALEHGAILELKRAMRCHPLSSWVKRTVGVG